MTQGCVPSWTPSSPHTTGSAALPPNQSDATGAFTPPTETAGAIIGPYKLIEQIGEGGMGTVWMAQQTEPVKRLVAVKLIKVGMDSKQVVARFEAERQALALMEHPSIARVLDAGTTPAGRPYFVMDLVKGVPITKYCDEHRLTPRQRLELFIPVCQAVQHAHQKGIIHRDLKPSNVLVALYDGKPVPKVIDFGVAKAAGQPLTEKTLVTGFGNIVGTLEYMSPEQAEINQLDIDTRSDIYSLGVLLYELLAGSPPFSRKELTQAGMLEMLRVIREEEPSKPSTKLSTAEGLPTLAANRGTEPAKLTKLVRGELDWIVMKALEKDRNRRYETANGFVQDIQRYLADEPVQACPPRAGYRFRKFARRNKAALLMASVAALAVLLVVGVVAASLGWMARERAARQAKLSDEIELALREANAVRDQVLMRTDHPHQWEAGLAEALSALKRAEGLALQGNASLDPALRERLHRLRATLEADENDRRFRDRCEEIALEQAGPELGSRRVVFMFREAAPKLLEAFQAYGIDVGVTAAAQVVKFIWQRPKPVQEQLLVGLHALWVHDKSPQRQQWLSGVLKEAETDPLRTQARDAFAAADWPAVRRLLTEAMAKPSPSPAPTSASSRFWLVLLTGMPAQTAATHIDLFARVQRAYPGDFWPNFFLGLSFADSDPPQWDEAIRYHTAALALRPRAPAVYLALGSAQQGKGDLDGAIATYRQALGLDPSFTLTQHLLGSALIEKGDLEGAIAAFRQAIAADPKVVRAQATLAALLEGKARGLVARSEPALSDAGRAIELAKEAVALMPEEAKHWSTLGLAQYQARNWNEAVLALQKAIELRKDSEAHDAFFLARAHGKLNQKEVARKWYDKAVQWMEKHQPASEELRRLRREAEESLKIEAKQR